MLTLDVLRSTRCQPRDGQDDRMSDAAIQAQLALLPGWTVQSGKLTKRFSFKNYYQTLAFVNAVAFIAHHEDHHPDLQVSYDRCTVAYDTHTVQGLSINDFICAAKVDALLG